MPDTPEQIHQAVVDHYRGLAVAARDGRYIVDCDPASFDDGGYGSIAYPDTRELPDGAVRASLGCGNPVAVADLRTGETVLDLGSGGGIDVLLSTSRVGPSGKVYGVDATDEMIELARTHAAEAGVTNVEFRTGRIEDLPFPQDHVDVVISNCVVNLSVDKAQVIAETFRVLKPGGRLAISDVIAREGLEPALRAAAERQVGCVVGTLTANDYRHLLSAAGFVHVRIEPIADTEVSSALVQATKPQPSGGPAESGP
jgi:2-polyprenyl-3-methyl-5-hydroxy-6-metoxy-1,4-benzoquinol methylase